MPINIFSPVKKIRKRGKARDEFDPLMAAIDQFAPREHQEDRETYYYNYRMMARYRGPLLSLLETAARIDQRQKDPDAHARALFIKLKAFYDVKDRLSLSEATQDLNLLRRFRDLFSLFYGQKNVSSEDIKGWLKKM
ncbi:MAG: hypothetical protein U5R49_20860 [Deltaproteobacteria bacterium]|nr:hypothetical protein [Deltaproteobacteria bacterium]